MLVAQERGERRGSLVLNDHSVAVLGSRAGIYGSYQLSIKSQEPGPKN